MSVVTVVTVVTVVIVVTLVTVVQNSKNQIVTKFINSNFDKTHRLKL